MNAAQRIAAFAEGGAEVRQAPVHDGTHGAHEAAAAEPLGGLSWLFLDFQHAGVVRTADGEVS
jgi:hypothetical protein